MKNLKKVLAMVLAFACTFTMFASAKVYEDVQPGSDYSEAITMLSDLGIIQGRSENKYEPESTITRAEACALIARLLTGDPNVANFNGAQNFTDVVKGSWMESPIGYCVANGITVGVGKGKFEPNRPINDQEFITMMVRALGYETPDMKQNYPFSYMTAANAIGLRHNTNMMANTDALRGEDAQVIYNALFVDYAKGVKMINTTHGTSVEKYKTLAESVWGLNRAALGTFTGKDDEDVTLTNCKAHTWVIVGADKKEEGRVLAYPIDDDTTDIYESDVKSVNSTKYVPYSFKYEGDADALKGYQVELWGEGKHGTPTWEKGEGKFVYSDEWNIKAIKTVAGQTKYDYDASKADAKSDNGTIEMDEKKLELDSVADNAKKVTAKNTTETPLTTYLSNVKYNGETATKDKDVEKALNVRDGAQYKLMDWDSDGDIDWVVVDEANYFKVESASSKRVTVTSMKSSDKDADEEKQTASETKTWKLDDLNDEKDYKVKYEVPEGLKEGDIVEVTYKTAYDKKEKCEVVTATATVVDAENHELDKVSTKDHLVLTFDGETKQLAQNKAEGDTIVPKNPTKYENFDEEELGTAFALYMNRNGFIVYSDYANDTSNYLMVLDTDDGKNTVRGELGAMKILTSDNKVENNVEVVSDLMIDRKTSGNGYDKDSRHFDEHLIVGNVYKYWKDADGKITKLESVVDGKHGGTTYEYVSKNDRLTIGKHESYALKDAKAIFAVKPNDDSNSDWSATGYIQHEKANADNLKVDENDVLAVKQADIPDIEELASKTGDTKAAILDGTAVSGKSWIDPSYRQIAYKSQSNKDIDGAILGVDNFNKFNAGATKIGLVTDVSYDKNDIVSIEVATNGKVETLSSVEKTKFEDVVSVYDYANKKSYSLASRNETMKNGLAKGQNLKDYLNKNAAYAEITTNADGKLTGVLFMDDKKSEDAANGAVNVGNVVAGRYYQVSRKVIADVNEGKWLSTVKDTVQYTSDENLYTLDSKNVQKVSDLAGDVAYYTIDGRPTINGLKSSDYVSKALTILNGFDGNPTVKVGEASDVQKSEMRNDNTANDLYNVADVASKIDKNGEGDIVAVYAYEKYMGEDTTKPKPVVPVKKFQVTDVQFARQDGTPSNDLKTLDGHQNQFVVYVGGTEVAEKTVGLKMQTVGAGMPEQKGTPVTGLTKDNFQVTFGGANAKNPVVTDAAAVTGRPGYYTLTLSENVDTQHAVTVTVVAGGNAASIVDSGVKVEDSNPEIGGGNTADNTPVVPDGGSEASKTVADITVKVDSKNLIITPKDKDGKTVSNLTEKDFSVKVNGNTIPVTATLTNPSNNEWTLTAVGGFDFATQSNITVTVGSVAETYAKVDTTAKIEDNKAATTKFTAGSTTDLTFEPVLTNLTTADVELKGKSGAADVPTGVTYADGVITVSAAAMKDVAVGQKMEFQLAAKDTTLSVTPVDYTITVEATKIALDTTDAVKYDVSNPDTMTITLDKKYSEDILNKLTWSIKTGGQSLFADDKIQLVSATPNNEGEKSVINMTFKSLNPTLKAGNVNVADTLDVQVKDSSVTKPTLTGTIKVTRKVLNNVTVAADSTQNTTVVVTLGDLSEAEVKALVEEIKKGTVGDILKIKSGTGSVSDNAVTAAAAEKNTMKLTVTTALNKDDNLEFTFTGSSLYEAITEAVTGTVA